MREAEFSSKFNKKVDKLKGQEFENIMNKVKEILSIEDLDHYKNLKYNLKKFKRVHVNSSYVIIFYDRKNNFVLFEDYAHHDEIYRK